MKAETAYQVIKALSSSETKRLYRMLGIQVSLPKKAPLKKPLLTDAEAVDFLLRKLKKPI